MTTTKMMMTAALALAAVSCGGTDEAEWVEPYRAQIAADWAEIPVGEQVAVCAQVDAMADEQMAIAMAVDADNPDNNFNTVMADLGLTPTRADYEQALEIAVAEGRSLCS